MCQSCALCLWNCCKLLWLFSQFLENEVHTTKSNRSLFCIDDFELFSKPRLSVKVPMSQKFPPFGSYKYNQRLMYLCLFATTLRGGDEGGLYEFISRYFNLTKSNYSLKYKRSELLLWVEYGLSCSPSDSVCFSVVALTVQQLVKYLNYSKGIFCIKAFFQRGLVVCVMEN